MPEATLGGIPLLASANVKWRLKAGVAPVVELFDVPVQEMAYLGGLAHGNVTLVLDDGNQRAEFKKLSILAFLPGANKFIAKAVVADRRWVWSYPHVLRRFNERRNAGFRRRGEFQETLQPEPVRDIQYSKWSLDPGDRVWTPEVALQNILTAPDALGAGDLKPSDRREQRRRANDIPLLLGLRQDEIVISGSLKNTLRNLQLDNITLDDRGDAAVARVLSYVAGANLFIDQNGRVVLYSEVDGGESRNIFVQGGVGDQEIVDGGHVAFASNDETRPQRVDVYFTIQCEVRFDVNEQDSTTEAPDDGRPKFQGGGVNEPRILENVLPIPDFTIDIAGKTLAQGTWISFPRYLDAITTVEELRTQGLLKNMTRAKWFNALRRAFIPEMGLWPALVLAGNVRAGQDEIDWASRLSAMQGSWRTVYRLPSRWMDSILEIFPWMTATIDPLSGQRAPAMVYSDYSIRNSQKALVNLTLGGRNDKEGICYATNYNGYKDQINLSAEGDRKKPIPSPARVLILDQDQGVIRINYLVDPYGVGDLVFPSKMDNIPCLSAASAKNPKAVMTFDSVSANRNETTQLSRDHRAAVFLTAVPASPNSKQQLYRVIVKPTDSDLISKIPPALRIGLAQARGPVKEVRVQPGLETARVRWKDDRVADIEAIFGKGDKLEPNFDDLIINDAPQGEIPSRANAGEGATAASLREIAVSIAAGVYAAQHDRFVGSQTTNFQPGRTPAGSLDEVSHELQPDGKFMSNVNLPPSVEVRDIFEFMDESTRRVILKQVTP